MVQHVSKEQIKEEYFKGGLYSLLLMIFLGAVLAIISYFLSIELVNDRQVEYRNKLALAEKRLRLEMQVSNLDLTYLSEFQLIHSFLKNGDSEKSEEITNILSVMLRNNSHYAQVRIIDTAGNEQIRVNRINGDSLNIVPPHLLQNKRKRNYFSSTINLQKGELYISRFDLNIEQGKVQYPLTPMIRFAAPIFDRDGEKLGVAVINYYGSKMIDLLYEINTHPNSIVLMANIDNGVYIKRSDTKSGWQFMLNGDRLPLNKDSSFTTLWNSIQSSNQGVIYQKYECYYRKIKRILFNTIANEKESQGYVLVIKIPKEDLVEDRADLNQGLFLGFIMMAPLLISLGWNLGRSQVQKKWMIQVMEREATHDPLTGLLNRRAIFDILEKSFSQSKRSKQEIFILFIDLNDLKKVNDTMGHEKGDEFILGLSQILDRSIRTSDYAARIGGDEFLVICHNSDSKGMDIVIKRIEQQLKQLGKGAFGFEATISYGLASYLGGEETVLEIVKKADIAMYHHKIWQKCKLCNSLQECVPDSPECLLAKAQAGIPINRTEQ